MQHQLQCNGLLRYAIRQMGYPVRMDFALFLRRYQVLARGRGDNILIDLYQKDLMDLTGCWRDCQRSICVDGSGRRVAAKFFFARRRQKNWSAGMRCARFLQSLYNAVLASGGQCDDALCVYLQNESSRVRLHRVLCLCCSHSLRGLIIHVYCFLVFIAAL